MWIAEAVAREEEGDAERRGRGQVGGEGRAQLGEVGGVEAEGEGLLLEDEEVGLEGVLDERQAAAVDVTPDVVEVPVAGVVLAHRLLGGGQQGRPALLPPRHRRVEAGPEEAGQPQRHLRVGLEGIPHLLPVEPVGLGVGQVGVAEGHEGAHQRGVHAGEHAGGDQLAVLGRAGRQQLGGEELLLQLPVERRADLQPAAPALVDVEGAERVGTDPGGDVEHVGAGHAEVEPVEHLEELGQEAAVGRAGHREGDPGEPGVVADRLDVEVEAAGPLAELEQPERLGDAAGRRDPGIVRVAEPEEAEELVQLLHVEVPVLGVHGHEHRVADGDRDLDPGGQPGLDPGVGLAVELEPLDLQRGLHPRHGPVGVGEHRVGDGAGGAGAQGDGPVERARGVGRGQDERVGPIGQDQVLVGPERAEAPLQDGDGLGLVLHGGEEVRGHGLAQPAAVGLDGQLEVLGRVRRHPGGSFRVAPPVRRGAGRVVGGAEQTPEPGGSPVWRHGQEGTPRRPRPRGPGGRSTRRSGPGGGPGPLTTARPTGITPAPSRSAR